MNAHKLSRAKFLSVMLLVLSLAASASAAFFIVTPPKGILPTLRTYNQTAADWWKWALIEPAATNPLLDETGADCARNQPFLGAWYLAGSLSNSGPIHRSCTIPNFRTLIIPVANTIWGAFLTDPASERTEAFVREQTRVIQDATEMTLTIDGTPVSNISRFYEESTLFNITLAENNIYELPEGTMLSPSADAGYYVAISGLLPGNHTISWHSVALGSEQDITYNIRINLL